MKYIRVAHNIVYYNCLLYMYMRTILLIIIIFYLHILFIICYYLGLFVNKLEHISNDNVLNNLKYL